MSYWVEEDEFSKLVRVADCRTFDSGVHYKIRDVLHSGQFINGKYVDEFAGEWAAYCDANYCVPVASGSAALTAALKAVCKPGSVVVVPALSFAATAFSIVEAGCKPLYVDVTSDGLMNVGIANEIIDRTKDIIGCVLPVHLYGQFLCLGDLKFPTSQVIEDACQAHGVKGVQGAAAAYSFYPVKNLGACGDAGAVVTNDKRIADYAKTYINYGDPPGQKYAHVMRGTNARMDAIQAAILTVKLAKLDADNIRRSLVAGRYEEAGIPSIATRRPCVWHQYPVLVEDPDQVRADLYEREIETGRHYPYILSDLVDGTIYGNVSNARFISQHVIALPIGPHLTTEGVHRVIDTFLDLMLLDMDGRLWRLRG